MIIGWIVIERKKRGERRLIDDNYRKKIRRRERRERRGLFTRVIYESGEEKVDHDGIDKRKREREGGKGFSLGIVRLIEGTN